MSRMSRSAPAGLQARGDETWNSAHSSPTANSVAARTSQCRGEHPQTESHEGGDTVDLETDISGLQALKLTRGEL